MTSYYRALRRYGVDHWQWPLLLWPLALWGSLHREARLARARLRAEEARWQQCMGQAELSLGSELQARLMAIPAAHSQVVAVTRPVLVPVFAATAAAMVLGIALGVNDVAAPYGVLSEDYQSLASLDITGSVDAPDWLEGE